MITGPAFPAGCCHQQAHPVELATGEIVSCVCVECWEPLPADYIARQLAACAVPVELTDDMCREIRQAAAMRYARVRKDGSKPIECHPTREVRAELRKRGAHSRPKLIFDTIENATDFAIICESIGGYPQRPYVCNRSESGHFHLTRYGAG